MSAGSTAATPWLPRPRSAEANRSRTTRSTPSTCSIWSPIAGVKPCPITLLTTKSPTKLSATDLSTLAFAESPTIAIVQASASPIISAEAVAVVRRGLRSEFWPARLPTRAEDPRVRRRGPAPGTGLLITGLIAATPSRIARMPPPICQPPCGRSAKSPSAEHDEAERDQERAATRSRRRSDDSGSAMSSRIAWTGAIRPVRRAGSQAAAMVTSTPTAYDAMKVRGREDQRLAGEVETEVREQRADAHREQHAEAEAEGRAEHAEHERLELHRPHHLPLGRAEGAQQRELAAALGDQDREGVDDQERADDQGDAREDQQERGQERDRLQQVGGGLVGRVVAGDGLDAVGQHRRRRRRAAPPGRPRPRRSPRRRCRRPRRRGRGPGRSGCRRRRTSRR